MYNNIGLKTVRGSGTNGYIQTNLAALPANWKRFRGRRRGFDSEEPDKKNKLYKPSQDLIDHNKKRAVEVKVFEYREKLEDQDFEEENIEEKVTAYRKYMLDKMAAGEFDEAAQYCGHNQALQGEDMTRGEKAVEQKKKNLKMQRALGISGDHVHGKAFDQDLMTKEKNERLGKMEQDMTTEDKIAFREQNYLDRLDGEEPRPEPLHRPGPSDWRSSKRSSYRDRMDERRGGTSHRSKRREFSRSNSPEVRKRARSRSPGRDRRRKRSRSPRRRSEEREPPKRWKADSDDSGKDRLKEKPKKKRKKDKDKKKKKKKKRSEEAQGESPPPAEEVKRKKKKKKKKKVKAEPEEGEVISGAEDAGDMSA